MGYDKFTHYKATQLKITPVPLVLTTKTSICYSKYYTTADSELFRYSFLERGQTRIEILRLATVAAPGQSSRRWTQMFLDVLFQGQETLEGGISTSTTHARRLLPPKVNPANRTRRMVTTRTPLSPNPGTA